MELFEILSQASKRPWRDLGGGHAEICPPFANRPALITVQTIGEYFPTGQDARDCAAIVETMNAIDALVTRAAPRLLHPLHTCGECAHRDKAGHCEEASESLVLEGYARGVVAVAEGASAETCPSFKLDLTLRPEMRPGWEERVDDAYQAQKEGAA